MSFRLHRGPKLLTLFHDAGSSSSQRILSLLQSRIRPLEEAKASTSDNNASDTSSPANQYLKSAAAATSAQLSSSSAAYELEVVDRRKATPDQWNTIGSYLSKSKRSQVEQLKDEEGAILVNWDDGQALQTEEAVQNLLNQLMKEGDNNSSGQSWWQRWTS